MSKLKILLQIAAILCAPCVFAQGNCSFIQNFLTSDTKNVGTSCDVHFNQTVTETQTYNVQCVDQTNNNNVYFNTSSQMTSTGQTSLFCGGSVKIDCSPTFQAQNVNAGFTSSTDNINQFFLRVWAKAQSGSECAQISFSQDLRQCAAVPCSSSPPPPPPCSPPPPDQEFTNNNPGDSGDCEPLILDLTGEGFHLTDTAHGVVFDIRADGHPLHVPWTADSRNGFLVLDRNGNGLVDDGSELFGNATPQPQSAHPNGFGALAQYDWNGDGIIDDRDPIYSLLRIWIDANHDGICQSEEMHMLPELGIFSINLDYSLSGRIDEYGNVFRYKAHVNKGWPGPADVGKTAYDVFLVTR